eukprot:TRINITY_DN4814_c0_g2_i1.p1 TRINITY_DN4814_c0_g2~~TRINITY_DN4814_c0_g2_i1.p1  ORF type:complete len:1459 (+),score=230.96 TRINITY_DN4814_c0_g2_i1:51-4379(+)
MYQACTKILESSSVTSTCTGKFLDEITPGLVVVKHDALELYSLPIEGDACGVQLVSVYKVSQAIESVLAVRFPGYDTDCLIIAFAEAKLSVLQWDHPVHKFRIVSLHLLDDPVMTLEKDPSDEVRGRIKLYLDPGSVVGGRSSECVLAFVHQRFLFVLPFARSTDSSLDIMGGANNNLPCEYPLGDAMFVDLHSHGMKGIPDIAFVDGYYTPAMMILHEDEQSWAGRLKMALGDDGQVIENKTLTMCASVLSITLGAGKIDVSSISIAQKLPYNAHKLVALRTEPYGALVLGVNSICHISKNEQSGYAIHVNNFGRDEFLSDTALQMPFAEGYLKDSSDKRISMYTEPGNSSTPSIRFILSLANARVIPVDQDRFFMVLATGEPLFIKVNRQGTVVSDISFALCEGLAPLSAHPVPSVGKPLPDCPMPSCLSSIGDYIFVGSRLGDSVILNKGPQGVFTKIATLQNIGPITDISLGDSSVELPEEVQLPETEVFPTPSLGMAAVVPIHLKPTTKKTFQEKHTSMEIVTASGLGKEGSVCVLQRTVKPLTLCNFDVPCEGVFSLHFDFGQKRKFNEETIERPPQNKSHHQCILLSTISSTAMLRTIGDDLVESTAGPFIRDEQTLFACNLNLSDKNAVCQVTKTSVAVFDDGESFFQHNFVQTGTAFIHQACSRGDSVVCFMSDATLQIVKAGYVTEEGQPPKLHVDIVTPGVPDILSYGFITAVSIARVSVNDPLFQQDVKEHKRQEQSDQLTDVLSVVTLSGHLFLYKIDDWSVIRCFPNILDLPEILTPDGVKAEVTPTTLHVVDLFFGKIDSFDSIPHLLFLTSDDQIHGYKGFCHDGLRFRKTHHSFGERRTESGGHPTAPPKLSCVDQSMELFIKKHDGSDKLSNVFAVTPQQARFTHFKGIMGNEGVFIRSTQGGWWCFSEKMHLRMHPMVKMPCVKSFCSLNTTTCKHGFALATENGVSLMLLTWHKRMNFKSAWPTRKIRIRSSPKFIVFDPTHRTYTLVLSNERPFKPVKTAFDSEADIFLAGATDKLPKEITPADGIPIPTNGRFELQLYSSLSWKPFSSVGTILENEKVLCCLPVSLKKPESNNASGGGYGDRDRRRERERSGKSNLTASFQAVGTAFPIAEDIPCRGRILLLRVRVGRTRDDRVLEVEHEISTNGPVTSITSSGGFLFATVAGKIHVYSYDWNKKSLDFVSWSEARMFTSSMTSIKNLILAGDLLQSVQLHRWTESGHQLTPLSKDTNSLSVSCCEFIVDRNTLTVVVFDDNGNISTFSYDPATSQQLLQPLSDMHIGTSTSRALRLHTFHLPAPHESDILRQGNRVALLFGTNEGAIYTLQPVMEHTHRDLHWLSNKMTTEIPHFAGLHPRASRKFRGKRNSKPEQRNRRSHILDMSLVEEFPSLPRDIQESLTASSGLGSCEQVSATIRGVGQEVAYL